MHGAHLFKAPKELQPYVLWTSIVHEGQANFSYNNLLVGNNTTNHNMK